ncbi:FG-GAP-like repeat-containing protein [Pseudozobellia sp. WGM2]|uniref:FG-GAP-like repeat-containing protein n=1 Tax=Pseudozobellia sp. WGM2 TaxID=2787625 RepID=UPI001ADEE507|nr:FG-GAP-like repeat-containing protein [Pseudozobellia sp. WGM2]
MIKILLGAICLIFLNMSNAQTNYQEVVLESTPINVTDRDSQEGTIPNILLQPQAMQKMSIGGNEISETTGELSVSMSGGAYYSLPIVVPPGINGVVPTIAISYNSQAGNGLAGYGWNISGLSVITRIASTKYHDNNIDPVDFDNLDRFALDGERLVLKLGTYGASGSVYETETFSNIKIVANGTSNYGASYGPASFTVTYPDGSVAQYGNLTNTYSRLEYAISSWQNPQGVKVDYTYTLVDNNLSISTIKYGHRSTGTAPNSIEFVYKTRKRPEQSYMGGQEFRRKNILSEIRVKTGATGYRNYILSHGFNTLGYERVNSVTEKNGDNSLSYSPVNFTYNDTQQTLTGSGITTTLTVNNIEQRNAEVVSLDYTGNGKMDFIVYPLNRSERNKIWVFEDIQSGATNIGSQVTTSIFENLFPISYLNASNKLDKAQGFALVTHTGTNETRFKINGQSYYGAAAQYYEKIWNAPSYSTTSYCSSTPTTNRVPMSYISGDFNGDGLSDVIAISKSYTRRSCVQQSPPCDGPQPIMASSSTSILINSTSANAVAPIDGCCECTSATVSTSTVYYVNLDRRISSGFTTTAGALSTTLKSTDRLLTADVNGDGKTDILHITEGKMYAYTLSASNSFTSLWTTTDSRIKMAYQPMLGDYNGDGKIDIMYPTAANSGLFTLFRSTGTSFVKSESNYPFTFKLSQVSSSPSSTYNLIPTDINGDGRTDILEYHTVANNNGLNGSQSVGMYFNTLSTASDVSPAFSYITSKTINSNLNHFPVPVYLSSMNKANNNLDFATISNNRVFYFTFGKDNREDMLLRSISNNGIVQNITYRDMMTTEVGLDNIPVYYSLSNQVYPYVDIDVGRGIKLAVAIDRVVSGTTSIRKVFSYEGAVSHEDGLGFIGFTGLARSEWNTGNSDRIWTITKHDMANRGALTSSYMTPYTVNFYSIPSDYIVKTAYVNASSIAPNKMFKLSNTSNVMQNRLEGTAISTSYIYDTYNNPTKITVDYSGQGKSVNDMTYGNSTGATYYIGRPLTNKIITTINGNTFSFEEQFTYTGNLITTKKTKGNGTQFDTETYVYDAFGNVLKQTSTPYGTTAREINFTYDTSGRYMLTSKNVEGLSTVLEYNTLTGTLKKETNPYGIATQFFYDSWNRLTKITDYLGKNSNTTYVESGYSYTVTASGDDGGSTISVYDPLKRLITEKYKDVLGQWVSKSYQYDKFDRPWKESESYIGSAASQWNIMEYDLYGRPNKGTSYTGKVTNITYSGQSVTVNDGTKTVVTTKNAMGNITQVTDPGGTITYTYYGNGAMKTSTYGGITLNVEQDGWGRKTKLIDPSAGTYTYSYNGFGELVKETTPKGTTDYTFSSLGKLTQKKVTGDNTNMTTSFTYDGTTKLPTNISLTNSDGNNSNTVITYDSYKRVTATVETNTFAKFSKWFTYDAFGRVATDDSEARLLSNNKYSRVKVKNTYANGQLKNINDNTSNEELFNITGLNARGQLVTATMGVGQKLTNTYDIYGYLTQALAQKNVTTTPLEVMKLTFGFNAQKGVLNSRTNSLFSWSESFTYDSMDRLLTFNDNNGTKNQNYDSKGRINTISSLGTFAYSSTSFQQTQLTLNATGEGYYNNYTSQNITYNAFKSPVEIKENGKEYYSFQYNDGMDRAHMFYGDTQTDKLLRRYRRHYSGDGSMEITWDKNTGKTTFVTYMGGDAYTAPTIYRSEQAASTNAEYQYLHRDYLGSILAITDKNGNLKEKRHFDAWGNIVKWTNGSGTAITGGMAGGGMLDRGYTGHEHLFGANLVHMNGRLYDSMLHRFLMPDNYIQDPFNTLSYNRYGYVWNNPLMHVDPSGEMGEFTEEPNQGWFSKFLSLPYVSWTTGVIGIYESFFGPINWDNVGDAIARPFREAGRWYEKNIGKPANRWFNKHIKGPIDDFFDWVHGRSGRGSAPPLVAHAMEVPSPSTNVQSNLPTFSVSGNEGGLGISTGDVLRTGADFVPFVGSGLDIYEGIRDGDGWQVAMGAGFLVLDVFTLGSASVVKGAVKTGVKVGTKSLAKGAVKEGTQGGLNLFKWGAPQTGKNVGWRTGDYMLHLPNKGTPKLNWKANYGALRREMGLGKPIFDSYRLPNGNLIPTKGFLNAERSILQGRGWIYSPSNGAWMPPGF